MPNYLPTIFFAASQAPKRRDGDSRLADRPSWGIPNSWMVYFMLKAVYFMIIMDDN